MQSQSKYSQKLILSLHRNVKTNLKIHVEPENTLDSQNNSEQKEEEEYWRDFYHILKIYFRAIVVKATCYWHKNISVDKWNKIEDSNMNTQNYSPLLFDKETKTKKLDWKKYIIFSQCWDVTFKRIKLDTFISP